MSITLLLADDSITIQRVIELTFSDEQVRVISVGDGQQAIQRIETERPDIVLADVGMPKVDGYGVAAHVKGTAALRHIPVLLLTGAFEPLDENRARATGCDGILVKPFKPEELLERVRELMAGQRSEKLWPAELPRVDKSDTPVVVKLSPVIARPAAVPPQAPTAAAPFLTPPPAKITRLESQVPSSVLAEDTEAFALPEPSEMLRPANRRPPHQESPRPRLVHRDLPPPTDAFDSELDMLDMALARLEPTARPQVLDERTASDFERDLQTLRSEQPFDAVSESRPAEEPANRQEFGDWDLPTVPGIRKDDRPARQAEVLAPVSSVSEPFDYEIDPVELAAESDSLPVFVAPQFREPVSVMPVQPPPAPVAEPEPLQPIAPPVVEAPPMVALPAAAPVAPAAPAAPARPSLASAFSALLAIEQSRPPARTLTAAPVLSESAVEDVVKRVLSRMTDDAVHKVVLDAAERLIREEIGRIKNPSDDSGH